MTSIAVLVPTRHRAKQMKINIGALLLQPLPANVEALYVFLAVEGDDYETIRAARELQTLWRETEISISMILRPANTTCVQGFNLAHQRARGIADWYVLGSDDQIYSDGWLKEALDVASITGAQVIGLNDLHTDLENYAPHYMIHTDFVEQHMGGVFVPSQYKTWWFDREICERARRAGLYAPAYRAVVEHRHPDWGTAVDDDTYRAAAEWRDADRKLYEQRRGLYA